MTPAAADVAPMLLARCGAMRETSARLRDHARAICEASARLRRLTEPRVAPPSVPIEGAPRAPVRAATFAVHCPMCGQGVSARELARAAGRGTHRACYDAHLRALEPALTAVLGQGSVSWCRSCVARALRVDNEDVYALSARLLARHIVRSAAATCGRCHRPRLVLVWSDERAAARLTQA